MNISPYISVIIAVLMALAVFAISFFKKDLPAKNPWSRKPGLNIFQRFRHNKLLLFLIATALLALVALGWSKYFNVVQNNLTPEDTVAGH